MHFLREVGLSGIPDWLVRIEVARYLGVDPDEWFRTHPPIWQDWALVALDVHNNLSTPAKKD